MHFPEILIRIIFSDGPVEYFQSHNNFILLDILSKSIFDFKFMYL